MLLLTQNNATDNIVVTLSELIRLTDPNYLFIFKHITNKTVISFVKLNSSDLSTHQNRYNEFSIATATLFGSNKNALGQYIYKVYEQVSASNLNPAGLNLIEQGKANLQNPSPFLFTTNAPVTTYQAYGG